MNPTRERLPVFCLLIAGAAGTLMAQDQRDMRIFPVPVADNVYVLAGGGGNIGASIGEDGVARRPLAWRPEVQGPPLGAEEVAALLRQAYSDDLTGLPNRAVVLDQYDPTRRSGDPLDVIAGEALAAGDALQLAVAVLVSGDPDTALGAAEGQVGQGAFEGHPKGQRHDLVGADRLVKADAPLGRPAGIVVAHADSVEDPQRAVVHPHRDRHLDHRPRLLEPLDRFVDAGLIALVGGISDIAENMSILTIIAAFPQRLDGVAWFSSLIKITKFGSGAIGAPLILILVAMLVWQNAAGRRAQSSETNEV